MHERTIDIKIITIENCPACDRLKETVQDLMRNNRFLKTYIGDVFIENPTPIEKQYDEFPVFQIIDAKTQQLLFQCIGCYSQATIMWKLIKWIVPNGDV